MFVDYATPGLGITRIRYNGYNLSLIVRHPLWMSGQSYKFFRNLHHAPHKILHRELWLAVIFAVAITNFNGIKTTAKAVETGRKKGRKFIFWNKKVRYNHL
mgnify:CR=1 FL=1